MALSNMNFIRALESQLRETQTLACGGGVLTKTIITIIDFCFQSKCLFTYLNIHNIDIGYRLG